MFHGGGSFVGNHFGPWIGLADQLHDFIEWNILSHANGQSLAVAPHGSDTNTDSIDWNLRLGPTEDLVRLCFTFPFLAALTIAQVFIDPRNQAARERYTKVVDRKVGGPHRICDCLVDCQDR